MEYKARRAGVPVVAVDPRHTSQTCPACGLVERGNRHDRNAFVCLGCGLAGPADHIAAVNIARRGVVVARAAVSQPNDSLVGVKAPGAGGVVSHDASSSPGASSAP